MNVALQRLLEIEDFHLDQGSHESFDQGYCAMEAVAYAAGEPFSDSPQCTCPVISEFVRSWQDALDDATRNRIFTPELLVSLIGTRDDSKGERRSLMAADWLVRVQTPAWLRLAGRTDHADRLASLPEITAMVQAPSIKPAIEAARVDARAARDAARAAAGAAAWAAAGAAARDAVWAAARAAVWAAAWAAAWDAAGAAARDTLEPTKQELQQSALTLLKRMIDA